MHKISKYDIFGPDFNVFRQGSFGICISKQLVCKNHIHIALSLI